MKYALASRLFFGLAVAIAPTASAVTSGFIASGSLVLDKLLIPKAKGIRTVFISVYNAEVPSRMPYGAQKLSLEKDAKGSFAPFSLDTTTMMMMASGALPKKVNIKAKLDKDGIAGPDSSGDLVGRVKNVPTGTKEVEIPINEAVK